MEKISPSPLYETPSMFITCVIHKNEFQSMTNISKGTQAIFGTYKEKSRLDRVRDGQVLWMIDELVF
jgi:hypothetical protein